MQIAQLDSSVLRLPRFAHFTQAIYINDSLNEQLTIWSLRYIRKNIVDHESFLHVPNVYSLTSHSCSIPLMNASLALISCPLDILASGLHLCLHENAYIGTYSRRGCGSGCRLALNDSASHSSLTVARRRLYRAPTHYVRCTVLLVLQKEVLRRIATAQKEHMLPAMFQLYSRHLIGRVQ